jgi:hypothetical protein
LLPFGFASPGASKVGSEPHGEEDAQGPRISAYTMERPDGAATVATAQLV